MRIDIPYYPGVLGGDWRTTQRKCPVCWSENTRFNKAWTLFCGDCQYVIGRGGNVSRSPDHRHYAEHGHNIGKRDPDYPIVPVEG